MVRFSRFQVLGQRFALGAFLGLLALVLQAGDAETSVPRLPPSVQAAVEKADGDIAKIDAESADRIAKVRHGLIGTLTKAQTEATKKGDLDLALYLKQAIQDQQAKIDAGRRDAQSRAGAGASAAGGAAGIKVSSEGRPEIWDNQGSHLMSTSPHQLSAYLKLPAQTKVIALRAKPGYGCERIIWTLDGQGETRMAREYNFTLKTPKEVVRIDGDHQGSNDQFSYGPLQYRLGTDGEWQDIPAAHLAPR